uniref:Histone-lysine N-methyltransferase SETMAR n=1 Tax=Heterorhabditis bacteriophora TaxID=37862 RepID=A0A1I7XFY9_HETBA
MTSDEKSIPYDNRRRSAQWLNQDEALKHFPKPKLHQKKGMATVGWSASGVIHYNFLCPDETTTAEKYYHEIDKMHQELQRLRPALVDPKGPVLQDNAQPHVLQMIAEIERTGLRDSTLPSLLTRPLSHGLSLFQSYRQLPTKRRYSTTKQ